MRILTAIVMSVAAYGADYTIDPAHSSAGFAVTHMMVSTVRGQFSKIAGTISYDPKNLAASKVEATVDVSSVDTRQAKRDDHLRSADFFEAAKYPVMTFKSTKWSKAGAKLQITGDLTIHGITKQVVFDVEGPKPELKANGGMVTGAVATAKVSRKEFGLLWNKTMDAGGVVVGDEVTITLDIEAKR